MSQNLQLLVAGTDLTRFVTQDSWSITQNWSRQGDTATFELVDEHDMRASLSFTVGPLATVVLTDVGLGQVLFSGVCTKPNMKIESPNLTAWTLDCVDWTYLSDRELVVGDYSGLTADQLAILVTNQADCGITAAASSAGGYVFPGPQIPRIQFNYCTLTQAWTQLSKLASLTTTYGWYVDENMALHFNDLTTATNSGWTFTDDITQAGNPNTSTYESDSFGYEWDATSIRNTVTVRGADYTSFQTDLFVGNGSQVSFPLTFVPDATNINNLINNEGASLTVGGVAATFSADTGSNATTQWIIQGNAANQWFLSANQALTPPTTAPAAATVISFTYPYLQPVVVQTADTTSVARFKTLPNGGVFAYYIGDSNLPTLLAAQKRATREVNTYAQPTERVQLTAPQTFTGHFRAGQIITVANGVVPDDLNGNVSGINDQFLVLQLQIQGQPGLYRTYAATAARI